MKTFAILAAFRRPGRRPGRRRATAWLAVLALVLQTLLPLGQILQAATADDTIYICTANGLVPLDPVKHGPSGLPDEPDTGSDDHLVACQVCTAGLFGAAATAPDTVTLTLLPTSGVKGRGLSEAPVARHLLQSPPPRGPPSLI